MSNVVWIKFGAVLQNLYDLYYHWFHDMTVYMYMPIIRQNDQLGLVYFGPVAFVYGCHDGTWKLAQISDWSIHSLLLRLPVSQQDTGYRSRFYACLCWIYLIRPMWLYSWCFFFSDSTYILTFCLIFVFSVSERLCVIFDTSLWRVPPATPNRPSWHQHS